MGCGGAQSVVLPLGLLLTLRSTSVGISLIVLYRIRAVRYEFSTIAMKQLGFGYKRETVTKFFNSNPLIPSFPSTTVILSLFQFL
jgi:hypothetical protein